MKAYNIWYCVLAIFLTTQTPIFAQKIFYNKKDKKLYVDEKPYITIEMLQSGSTYDYSVSTLAGEEVIFFKQNWDKGYYEVLFMKTDEKAYYDSQTINEKQVGKVVFSFKLLKDDAIDEDAKKRYIMLYGKEPTPRQNPFANLNLGGRNQNGSNDTDNTDVDIKIRTSQGGVVERNKYAPVTHINGELSQGGVKIGSYTDKTDFANGKMYQTFIISSPNGVAVAEAVGEGAAPQTYRVFTYADRRATQISVTYSSDPLQDIGKYLSDNRYL
jgi:hypothetical protein